jgi:CHAT domain-containing protein/Tfp pilus assembly protein PilF
MPLDEWKIVARPELPPDLLALHQQALERIAAEKPLEAADLWEKAAGLADRRDPRLEAWLLLRAGGAAVRARDWKRGDDLHTRAFARLDGPPLRRESVFAVWWWADSYVRRAAWKEAQPRFEQALRLQEQLAPESLIGARLLRFIADMQTGDEAGATAHLQHALEIRERLAPESGAVADSCTAFGRLTTRQGDTAATERWVRRAVEIRERTVPGSITLAVDQTSLARALSARGDYAAAEPQVMHSLRLFERLAPKSNELAFALSTAGLVALSTGDVEAAETYQRRALEIHQALAPNGLNVASTLRALTTIAWTRRDFATAESRCREALAILQRLAPDNSSIADLLHVLGDIALDRGDPATAEGLFREALAVDQKQAPDGARVAIDLRCLSLALARTNRADEAEPHAQRAVEIQRRLSPGSLTLAQSLATLAETSQRRGRLDAAADHYRESLAIATRFGAPTRQEVVAYHGLGQVERASVRPAEASEAFAHAIDTIERLWKRLGGTDEARTSFSAAYAGSYQEAMEVLVELGRPEAAFRVLEQSRVRSLMDLLSQRPLLFSVALPADLARARQINRASYDRAQTELEAIDPGKDPAKAERLLARLRDLRDEQVEIQQKVRAASPRVAEMERPVPCDLASARAALDTDGVFVAYAVGREKTLLFVVEPEGTREGSGLSVFTLPIGEARLRDDIESFRSRITRPYAEDRERDAQASALYDQLLRPAEEALGASRHVAISPDGPLHLLPFAALRRGDAKDPKAPAVWLAEWRPIHIVASASLFAELKKSRPSGTHRDARLVAFGDPLYPAASSDETAVTVDARVRLARSQGARLGPLPSTRREVESIAALFTPGAVTYLGAEATEAHAKAGLEGFSYVHFACHGLLDEDMPGHSALVLSPPADPNDDTENGLLQVWEILDGMHLDADLVTLSACNTGLGREKRGEGLQGLTRAFQYAGARSVLASLWSASDQATADLMTELYGALKKGHTKADALQEAQREQIRRGAPPFHWAAFELFGDWR